MHTSIPRHLSMATAAFAGLLIAIAIGWFLYPITSQEPIDQPLPHVEIHSLQEFLNVLPTISGSGVTLSFPSNFSLPEWINPTISLAFPDPLLMIATSNGKAMLMTLGSTLDDSILLPANASLHEAIRKYVGDDISPTFDLLPLLEGPTTFQVAKGSGALFLFQGMTEDRTGLAAALRRLHQGVTATIPAIEERHRTFEPGKSFDDLRRDPNALVHTQRQMNGWQVEETRDRAGTKVLITGTWNNSFILSNSTEALEAFQSHTYGSLMPPTSSDTSMAAGLIDVEAIRPHIEYLLPAGTVLPVVEGVLRWSMASDGECITATVTR